MIGRLLTRLRRRPAQPERPDASRVWALAFGQDVELPLARFEATAADRALALMLLAVETELAVAALQAVDDEVRRVAEGRP